MKIMKNSSLTNKNSLEDFAELNDLEDNSDSMSEIEEEEVDCACASKLIKTELKSESSNMPSESK